MRLVKEGWDKKQFAGSALFADVEVEDLAGLLKDCPVYRITPGEILLQAGQSNRFLYLLLSGSVTVHLKTSTSKPIAVLRTGEIVGEMSLLDRGFASAYVVARQTTRVLALEEQVVWRLMEHSEAVARNLLRILSQRLRHADSLVEASLVEQVAETEFEQFDAAQLSAPGDLGHGLESQAAQSYKEATNYVLNSIQRAKESKALDISLGRRLTETLATSIRSDSSLLRLATQRAQKFAVATHSLNVSILSLRIAQTLGYSLDEQVRVGLAGLLHEIGVASLGEESREAQSKTHDRSVYGGEIVKKLCPEEDWLAEIIEEIQEREDGSGFPLGLAGGDMREEAKILGVADLFEAAIHDRPHRKALTGYEFMRALLSVQRQTFSEYIVKAMVKSFSPYPYNEYVLLSTDEIGRVVEVNMENLMRPVVHILYDSEKKLLEDPRKIDLSEYPSIRILQAIPYHALPEP